MTSIYPVSSRDYLLRAKDQLDHGEPSALCYAAFELRCGIEARIQEHLQGWDHVTQNQKKGWQIANLGNSVEHAFRTGDQIVEITIGVEPLGQHSAFYYTPVTRTLRNQGEKLGNLLHAQRSRDARWWETTAIQLREIYTGLSVANAGTLLGPPMLRKPETTLQMQVEVLDELGGLDVQDSFPEKTETKLTIKYLASLPDPPPNEAVLWRAPQLRIDDEDASVWCLKAGSSHLSRLAKQSPGG